MKNIKKYLNNQNIEEIVEACNDIFEWRYITGKLNKFSIVHRMANECDLVECEVAEEIEFYANQKFDKIVKLLFFAYALAIY